jgi:molybdopterin molybdotransferase
MSGAGAATMARRRLIPLEDAKEIVLAEAHTLDPERVPLSEAQGRVLARPVVARDEVPRFDNSAMDGFAVRAADTAGASGEEPVALQLVGESRAGMPATAEVDTGQAMAISTGAVLPGGADAVVPLEDARADDGVVEVGLEAVSGRSIRHRGDDIAAGEEVIAAGSPIGPAELGVLASLGVTEIACGRRPRVALVISGDELIEPGAPLAPGQIHDSNAFTLGALAKLAGADLAATDHVGDDRDATRTAIESALEADAAVISGGVSVGEHDHVRPTLDELGAKQRFWGVALRPGRPTWFGPHPGGALVFGLPGNPVSAMVTFLLFARPALLAMQGASPKRHRATAILDQEYSKPPGRAHAVRCRLTLREDGWHVRPTKEQTSHILTSMLGADALALIPADSRTVPAGSRVEIELLPEALT